MLDLVSLKLRSEQIEMGKFIAVLTLGVLISAGVSSNPVTDTSSLVVSSTETSKESGVSRDNDVPKIYSMDIQSNISNRFATTLITSKVKNLKSKFADTTFSVLLPKNAFISEFVMIINDKPYKAYVKEKAEAKQIYDQAVSSGQGAAHVEVSARESNTFTVSVNIEPASKATFLLTYEELLARENEKYELVLNINPGQIVKDLSVEVLISESRPLKFVKTPSLRTGNEISKNDDKLDPSADIKMINSTAAVVKFHPDEENQKKFAGLLETNIAQGFSGQFVVEYDVERDPQGGEILVRDGYFVHFFSPTELEPLPKHVVFVLDHSGSMAGRKFDQLTVAMKEILSQLSSHDVFNMVRFSDVASVWDVKTNQFLPVITPSNKEYGKLAPALREDNLPAPAEVLKENIEKAQTIIEDSDNLGSTNIIEGLEVGLFLIARAQETATKTYQPMIVFLTDGQPNVGLGSTEEIVQVTTKLNSLANRTSIFSLSFGDYADKKFLQKLSLQNLGFSRHIYEAADASLQLQEFYRLISSPLLSNITFKYIDEVTQVTKTHYPILFRGSECVVVGRTSKPEVGIAVDGYGKTGPIEFKPKSAEPTSSLERLWAYLTIKQILDERETVDNKTELTKQALDIALKYSFVTEVSSLVVVKPNKTDSVNADPVDSLPPFEQQYSTTPAHLFRPAVSFAAASLPISDRFDSARPLVLSEPIWSGVPAISPIPHNSSIAIPLWLQVIVDGNGTISTPQGNFAVGKAGDVTVHPDCPKTPLNGTGVCTILFDCPSVFPLLTDETKYLEYFCSLNTYAGVCCPK